MRDLFLLDPGITFLNHGSFGACPRPVFASYQRLQLELERRPVEFLGLERRYPELIGAARERLAAYLGARPADLVFVPNSTSGLNAFARSVRLDPGDEVLATDEEYGGMDMLWRFVCAKSGAQYVRVPVEQVAAAVTGRTRVVFFSHIASPTARIFPVGELVAAARAAGALAVVDGSHAPGQVPLALDELGADVYAGNCHKWMCAPKGAGFLWVRPELQELLEPLIVSWDWEQETEFAERHRWQGTRDPAAYLAVPAAIDFMQAHDWDAVRARCHALAVEARERLAELFGLEPLDRPEAFGQMVAAPLPPTDVAEAKRRLYEEHRIEAPLAEVNGRPLVRLSFQAYNDHDDLERVLAALPRVV